MQSPKLYSTFLLWLLSELFESLPEIGDPEKPKLVFFFDEAHLLFEDAPEALFDKVEQVVRLVRSKGVGVYFISQNPIDIPEKIAGQLGNRVQHALRAFTPRDQRAIKAAAETFRINPDLDVETAITELKVGEALVSTLEEDGSPSIVQRTLIAPPRSRLGPVTDKERAIVQSISPADGKYDTAVDRESGRRSAGRKRPPMPRKWPSSWKTEGEEAVRDQPRKSSQPLGKGRQGGNGRCGIFGWSDDRRQGFGPADERIANGFGGHGHRRIAGHGDRRRDARAVCEEHPGRAAALRQLRKAWLAAAGRPGNCRGRQAHGREEAQASRCAAVDRGAAGQAAGDGTAAGLPARPDSRSAIRSGFPARSRSMRGSNKPARLFTCMAGALPCTALRRWSRASGSMASGSRKRRAGSPR